jgi:hypothetical protein
MYAENAKLHGIAGSVRASREGADMGKCSECTHAIVIYNESPCYECVMGFKDAFEQKTDEE